jgi:hypothetical protein
VVFFFGFHKVFRTTHADHHFIDHLVGNHLYFITGSFNEQFSNTGFNVLKDFLAFKGCTEMTVQHLQVALQFLKGILVDVENASANIDCKCLFHCL